MALKEIRPMIRTRQLKETVAFYRERLGFTCEALSEEWGWAALPVAAEPFDQPVFTGSLYFLVDEGIDALWTELKDNARCCYGLETFDYGMREFALYDNNGYLLQFGQPVREDL